MSSEEKKQFLRYVFHKYVQDRASETLEILDKEGIRSMESRALERLRRAVRLLHAVSEFEFGHDYEAWPESVITVRGLIDAIRAIERGVELNNELLEQSGFMDALDAYFDELIDGIEFEFLPKQEVELLRSFGSTDPELDLQGFIYLLKSPSNKGIRSSENKLSVRQRLREVEEQLSKTQDNLRLQEKEKPVLPKKKSEGGSKGLDKSGKEPPCQ
jgi:hypothetical protein